MTAREDILAAVHRLDKERFTVMDVLREMRDSTYSESTIRTHVTSRMCANAPDNHGTTYNDLVRVRRGLYKLR